MAIKNIILDLGGVLFDLDYPKTEQIFSELGMDQVFSKAQQVALFDNLEEGKISQEEFIIAFNKAAEKNHTAQTIIDAWNAMLLGIEKDKLDLLKNLKSKYKLFLYSNTNSIHIKEVWKMISERHILSEFKGYFDNIYLSNEIQIRKPKPEGFQYIIEQEKLQKHETLFIDDSPQHVEGAKKAGIEAHWLDLNKENIHQLLNRLQII